MTRTLMWSVTALLGIATLAACTATPKPQPSPSTSAHVVGLVTGRVTPCTHFPPPPGQAQPMAVTALQDGVVKGSTESGPDSRYSLRLLPGTYSLSVDNDAMGQVTVIAGETSTLDRVAAC